MVVLLWVNRDYLTTIDLGSSRCFLVMDRQKRDYLSRASRRVTKNVCKNKIFKNCFFP